MWFSPHVEVISIGCITSYTLYIKKEIYRSVFFLPFSKPKTHGVNHSVRMCSVNVMKDLNYKNKNIQFFVHCVMEMENS